MLVGVRAEREGGGGDEERDTACRDEKAEGWRGVEGWMWRGKPVIIQIIGRLRVFYQASSATLLLRFRADLLTRLKVLLFEMVWALI